MSPKDPSQLEAESKDSHSGDNDLSSELSVSLDRRRTLTKIDLRILPILTLVYLCAFLDRVNIGNAQVFGLGKELKLKGAQYNLALCIFFIPYILFEIPSNVLLKRLKPHVFLSICIFMFGIVTLAQGFVTSYGALLTSRFFLGFFEAGIFPGCFYLLAMWYRRTESQKRFTFFFLSTSLAGAFGGLLASAIGNLDGHGGKLAWRWIFIIEGAVTCVVAFLAYFAIPDFPEDVTWLSDTEKKWVQQRLVDDVGSSGHAARPLTFKDLRVIFTDYKFMTAAFMYFGFLVPAYGFAFFAPAIIRGWKFSPIGTQLRTVPIWFVSWFFSMALSITSDRLRHRFGFIVGPIMLGIIGFIVLLTTRKTHIGYGALFLASSGTLGPTPICINWLTTNLAGHNRRAIGSAFQIGFGNLGGVVSTFIFMQKEAPTYKTGYGTCLGALVLALTCAVVFFLGLSKENRDRDAGKAGLEKSETEDLGDLVKEYRYMR